MSVRVHFLLEDLEAEAPDGCALLDVAEAVGADITFGCRTGSCGTCRVRVASGLDAPADQRLACRVKLNGDVAIEYLGV